MIRAASIERFFCWLRREPFLAAVSLLALLYVALGLCPSAYSLVLARYGVADTGLLFGWPQEIRSDESAIWTPTVQAAVAGGFAEVNESSLYRESFRTLSAMPIRDWGLVFKPQFWAFFVLPPAYGYAAHFAFYYWLLLVGWTLFLRWLGVGRREAAAAAILLLACSWTEVWWTSFGPILATAPLIAWPALLPLSAGSRFAASLFVTAFTFLAGFFYPPLILATGLAVAAALAAFRPELLRPRVLLPMALGAVAGLLLAVLYLREPIVAMAGTVAHGQRNLGGGGVPWQDWLGNFLPSFSYSGWQAIHGINACEAGAGGSILVLLALCFARRRRAGDPAATRRLLVASSGLAALFAATSLWMLAPVPAILGKPLLWHIMPASRLLLLPGLLSLLLVLLWLPHLELRFTFPRAAAAAALLALAAGAEGFARPTLGSEAWLIPLVFLLPLGEKLLRGGTAPAERGALSPAGLVAAAALGNLLLFGLYNPLQSSRAIFAHHDSPRLAALRAMASAHPRGWLVAAGPDHYGSILNGFGFRSVNHSLLSPQMAAFESFFPELPAARRNTLFNRYANILLSSQDASGEVRELPEVAAENAVLVPAEPFLAPLSVVLAKKAKPAALAALAPALVPAPAGAATRQRWVKKRRVEIEVAGAAGGFSVPERITVATDPPAVRLLGHWRMPPPGPPAEGGADPYSLLILRLTLASPPDEDWGWCVTVHDRRRGDWNVGPQPGEGRSICR